MPLTPSSFFVPPPGLPFILEDKYIRGGFRAVATTAERDAIPISARKAGMRVLVADASYTTYELKGGTGNGNWIVSTSVPVTHTHTASEITDLAASISDVVTSMRGGQTGLAYLLDGKIDPTLIPSLSIGDTFVVNSESEMLAAIAGKGDVAVRVDIESSFILSAEPASVLSNWQQLLSPTSGIVSVNGQTNGTIVLDAASVGAAPVIHTHGISEVVGLSAALDSKAPVIHQHASSDISDLTQILDTKANTVHAHTMSDVTGLVDTLSSKASNQSLLDGLSDKATVQALSDGLGAKADIVHAHSVDNITNLQSILDGKAETAHGHAQSDITGLVTDLAGKAPSVHTHDQSDITGLVTDLAGKAPSVHSHAQSDITGLVTDLAGKAPSVHGHAISDVTGLQTSLDGKAATSHTHAIATTAADGLLSAADKIKLNGIATGANNYTHPTGDGNLHVPATSTTNNTKVLKAGATAGSISWGTVGYGELSGVPSTFTPSAHVHAISDVTGLQTAIDSKLDKIGGTVTGNLIVTGDLLVQGTNTVISTSLLEVEDPIITVAKDNSTGVIPYAGIKMERGGTDAFLVWNEATDRFTAYTSADDLATAGVLANIQAATFYGALSGNATSATAAGKWSTARTLTFTGDATSTATPIDGSADVSIALTVADDSHAHSIATVTGLQTALDGKAATSHTHAVATTTVDGLLSAADKTKLNGIATSANNYVHPAGDGNLHVPATSTTNANKVLRAGATAGSLSWGFVGYSELTGVPATFAPSAHTHAITDVTGLQTELDAKAATSHVHAVATTTVDGFFASADKTKLNGIASGANNYVHPAGDGNLHVPATGTTNNTKVLKAGATAGSVAWGAVSYSELSGVPSTFAPSAHAHAITDVTGLQTALDGKLATTGTAANSNQLQGYAASTGASANTIALRDSAGKINAVDFTMTSDLRLKDIVNTIDDDEALSQVLSWESVRYTMKDGDGRIMPGFIAQQIQTVTPELVIDSEEYLSVSYALSSAYYAAAFRAVVKRLERIGA